MQRDMDVLWSPFASPEANTTHPPSCPPSLFICWFYSNTIHPWGVLFTGGLLMRAMWRSTDSTKLRCRQSSLFYTEVLQSVSFKAEFGESSSSCSLSKIEDPPHRNNKPCQQPVPLMGTKGRKSSLRRRNTEGTRKYTLELLKGLTLYLRGRGVQ